MFSISDFEPWWRFGFALVIGALIGLEREFHNSERMPRILPGSELIL